MRSVRVLALVCLTVILPSIHPLDAQNGHANGVDPFAAMRARSIGPAGMSGRVSDVEVVLRDRSVMYVGASTGGLFKSSDGGITWDPVFDDQPALGIGAVAVFQPNPGHRLGRNG